MNITKRTGIANSAREFIFRHLCICVIRVPFLWLTIRPRNLQENEREVERTYTKVVSKSQSSVQLESFVTSDRSGIEEERRRSSASPTSRK